LGGGFHGERLNRLYAENIGEERILEILSEKLAAFAKDRTPGQRFGDFITRVVDQAAPA
jgi:sulfite reductase (NADPH) hemoprotein beta-component